MISFVHIHVVLYINIVHMNGSNVVRSPGFVKKANLP